MDLSIRPKMSPPSTLARAACAGRRTESTPSRRRRWTKEEDERLVALRADGLSHESIAEQLGCSATRVTSRITRLVQLGAAVRMDPREMSRRGGLACGARRNDRITELELARVEAMWKSGAPMVDIAIEVGRSITSVQAILRRLRAEGRVAHLSVSARRQREDLVRERTVRAEANRARETLARTANTKDFGYVVGLLYGDAYVESKSKCLILKTVEESFARAFAEALEATFQEVPRRLNRVEPLKVVGGREYRNVIFHETHFNRSHLVRALEETFGNTTKKGWNLDVEAALARGPDFCCGLIQGLFDSDGSISLNGKSSGTIRYGSTNATGVASFTELLRRMGYEISVGPPSKKGERRISILAASQIRYAGEIGSRIARKSALLEELVRRKRRRQRQLALF